MSEDLPDDMKSDIGKLLSHMASALNVIAGKKEDQGSIPCPKCGGKLLYSRARSNGHVHGRCETADCLRWMQ